MRKKNAHHIFKTILSLIISIPLIINGTSSSSSQTLYAASPVTATFYLVDEKAFASAYPNIDLNASYLKNLGKGTISYTGYIVGNHTAAQKTIIKSPTTQNYKWSYVVKYGSDYFVAAPFDYSMNTSKNISKSTTAATKTNLAPTPKKENHILNKQDILSITSSSYPATDTVQWDKFRKGKNDVTDGIIPMNLLNDPIYTSMNLPSESQSQFMIDAWRDNGHITGFASHENATKLLNFGSVEVTAGETLPDTFSVYLGKIKMFAYSKSKQKWITIDSQPYPQGGVYVYIMPWSTGKFHKCQNVQNFGSYLKVDLTKDMLQSNSLHFWGKSAPLNNEDYLYYAASYEVWTSGNAVGKLTASGGIDVKDSTVKKTFAQLYSSRGIKCTTSSKSVWGTTIPNSVYKPEWGGQILNLYNQ